MNLKPVLWFMDSVLTPYQAAPIPRTVAEIKQRMYDKYKFTLTEDQIWMLLFGRAMQKK